LTVNTNSCFRQFKTRPKPISVRMVNLRQPA